MSTLRNILIVMAVALICFVSGCMGTMKGFAADVEGFAGYVNRSITLNTEK